MSGAQPTDAEVARWRERVGADLWQNVLPFWMRHSLDQGHGGYSNQLARAGRPAGETGPGLLAGRSPAHYSPLLRSRGRRFSARGSWAVHEGGTR